MARSNNNTQPKEEKRNTDVHKLRKSVEDEGLLANWTLDDEYSPEKLGIKPKAKYTRDEAWEHLRTERIVAHARSIAQYRSDDALKDARKWLVISGLTSLSLAVGLIIALLS